MDTVLGESLGGSDDPTVLAAASSEGRMLVTLDRGFGDIRTYPPGEHPGIIVLRPNDQSVTRVTELAELLFDNHDIETLTGCVVIVDRDVVRVRHPESREPRSRPTDSD